jgi:hypothetical protein
MAQGYTVLVGPNNSYTYNGSENWTLNYLGNGTSSSMYIYQIMSASFTTNISITYTPTNQVGTRLSYYTGPSIPFNNTNNNNPQNNGWTAINLSSTLTIPVSAGNYFGLAYGGAGGPGFSSSVTISGMPNADGTCFIGQSKILMSDGTYKELQYIERGDFIVEDIETNKIQKVAKVYKNLIAMNGFRIKQFLIGNEEELVCTNHPIFCNNGKNRIYPSDIEGVENIVIHDYVYNIQYEDEGSFYVGNTKVDSLSPNAPTSKLDKELFYDESKFIENFILKGEDDVIRNKPPMTNSADNFKTY